MTMSTATQELDPAHFRQTAIDLVKMGFTVIRLRPGGNLPKDQEYYNRCASTPEAAHSMWTDEDGHPERFNIGILTGTPLPDGRIVVAVDIDMKDGRNGVDDARTLRLPATLMFRTKSGGFHMVYGCPNDGSVYRSSARSKLAAGIDTRGWHGYIVAPGSIVGTATYTIHRRAPIGDAPAVIVDHMRRTPDAQASLGDGSRPPLVALDEDHALVYAAQFLSEQPVVGVGARNDTVAEWTRQLRDRALSPVAIIEAISRHTELGRDPSFTAELVKTVNSAWKSSQLPAGNKSAAADFVDLSDTVKDPPKRQRTKLDPVPFEVVTNLWKTQQEAVLVENLLDQGAVSVMYGQSGIGKTFVAMDLAYRVATGITWAGLKTEQKAVIYLLSEGAQGASKRFAALRRRYSPEKTVPLFLITKPVNLYSLDGEARAVADAVKEIEETSGFNVGLIVVDTLARAMAGGDENSSQDMSQFVGNIDLIREHTGCHVLLVHHTGKDISRGARGSSALRAAVDTEIELEPNVIRVTKQRNIDANVRFDFRLIKTTLGVDTRGEEVTTCLVEIDVPSPDDIPDLQKLEADVATEIEIERDLGVSPLAVRVLDYLLARSKNHWIAEKALWDNVPEPPNTKASTVRVRRLRALAELSQRGAITRDGANKRLKAKE